MLNLDENITLINYSEFSYLQFSKEAEGKTLEEAFGDKDLWYDPLILDWHTNKKTNKHIEYLKKYYDYKILKVERDNKTGFWTIVNKVETKILKKRQKSLPY